MRKLQDVRYCLGGGMPTMTTDNCFIVISQIVVNEFNSQSVGCRETQCRRLRLIFLVKDIIFGAAAMLVSA